MMLDRKRGRLTRLTRDRSDTFAFVFYALKAIFLPYEKHFHVTSDTRRRYYLETRSPSYKNKPLFFGAVLSRHSYISFHLMPSYWDETLLQGISPELKKHMQGKTCFNFTTAEPVLFRELAALTRAGFALYRAKNLL